MAILTNHNENLKVWVPGRHQTDLLSHELKKFGNPGLVNDTTLYDVCELILNAHPNTQTQQIKSSCVLFLYYTLTVVLCSQHAEHNDTCVTL